MSESVKRGARSKEKSSTYSKRCVRLCRRLPALLHEGPKCSVVQVIYVRCTLSSIQRVRMREAGAEPTICLPPGEIVLDFLGRGV